MKKIFLLPAILSLCVVVGFLCQLILPGDLLFMGIRPRSLFGLSGVALSPFLHSGFSHLISNLIPLFILSCFVNVIAPALFLQRTLILILLSGLLTWLASSSGLVVGASGLVFAFWAFLLTNAAIKKRFRDIAIAGLTLVFYGAMVFSLFRYQQGVSWVAHISGVIAGIALATYSAKRAA